MPVSMPSAGEASTRVNSSSSSPAPLTDSTNSFNMNGNHSDVLRGLSNRAWDTNPSALKPAERLRLVHTYVTATSPEGGLGIHPDNNNWSRVESIMALHDPEYSHVWIRSVTKTIDVGDNQLEFIRGQFGEAVALYFAFLASYTHSLIFISVVGFITSFFGHPYSITFSSLLFLWSIVFVEYWRIRERRYSVAWGCLGSVRVENHRPSYIEGQVWWKRELKILVSVPVIALFASVLAVLLTAIFIFEAFVALLYTGPGHEYISYVPTVVFAAVIPRFLAIYDTRAETLTRWENHKHQSSYDASLTIKTFALASIVSYLGLFLSAFIYVPFGETVMNIVQQFITANPFSSRTSPGFSATENNGRSFFVSDASIARDKLSHSRLESQVFASTVTNQAINFFLEVGLPYFMRAFTAIRSGKGWLSLSGPGAGNPRKKRVGFEDEKSGAARDEREFLERVRREVSLPQYELPEDYNEMVTQFGYVTLWSTIWPLAPLMCLINNVVEFPSDAFKIVEHFRRPIPKRTDTIGPWLDCLSFLVWLSALTNSALVYLFHPRSGSAAPVPAAGPGLGNGAPAHPGPRPGLGMGMRGLEIEQARMYAVLGRALFIALAASHGYIVLRAVVRHVLERALWYGSKEKRRLDDEARQVKERYLQSVSGSTQGALLGDHLSDSDVGAGASTSVGVDAGAGVGAAAAAAVDVKTEVAAPASSAKEGPGSPPPPVQPPPDDFWKIDEGLDEIRKRTKEA